MYKDDRRHIMMEYVKNHEDSTAAEIAEATGYASDQVREALGSCRMYNGERFRKGQDHSRKGSPIVYWIGAEKLRGSLQKEMMRLLALYDKGIATGSNLREIAHITELSEGKEKSWNWWQQAAEQGDLWAIQRLEE